MNKLYEIAQLDRKLQESAICSRGVMPRLGWIKSIRGTIGMTCQQLANRLGVSGRRMAAIEEAEIEHKLKLETLMKVAQALGCELHYVFIPRGTHSFLGEIQDRALRKAREILSYSGKQMSLEDQLADDRLEEQAQLLAQSLLHKSLRKLWDD